MFTDQDFKEVLRRRRLTLLPWLGLMCFFAVVGCLPFEFWWSVSIDPFPLDRYLLAGMVGSVVVGYLVLFGMIRSPWFQLSCPHCRGDAMRGGTIHELRRTRRCPCCTAPVLTGRARSVSAYRRMRSHANRKWNRPFGWGIAYFAAAGSAGTQLSIIFLPAVTSLVEILAFFSLLIAAFASFCTVWLWLPPSKKSDTFFPMLISLTSLITSLTFLVVVVFCRADWPLTREPFGF